MNSVEIFVMVSAPFSLGAYIGHTIGWSRAVKRLKEFGAMYAFQSSSVMLLEPIKCEKPRIRCNGQYWSGTYKDFEAVGTTPEEVLQWLYQESAKSKIWRWK